MDDTWILVANGSRAHVLSTDTPRKLDQDKDLVEISCFEHPESREKMTNLTADVYGRHTQTAAGTSGSSDFVEKNETKEQHKIQFARELANQINASHMDKSFGRLVLVMPPAFYGHFKPLLSNALQKEVLMHINKDYSGLAKHELRMQLLQHLNLSD